MAAVEHHVPEVAQYTKMQIGEKPVETVFHNRKTGATQIETQTRGVPQGNSLSTSQFRIVLSDIIKILAVEYGEQATIAGVSSLATTSLSQRLLRSS
jgi:hypothetical protein